MILQNLIDLTEVKCQDFDKIISAKKGWNPMVIGMVAIVCCTRTKMERARARRFDDRQRARRSGIREEDLQSEKQLKYERDINEEWKNFDLQPGNHITEETIEAISRLIYQRSSIQSEELGSYNTATSSRKRQRNPELGKNIWKDYLEN
ncbi:hypothetical protein OXYTRIMIC_273 [Oxytricha trifallax]|uniref:Uncharacterized protein n=1 Tax=Oxytricha trifallax TaxID=1172189 RepID=A0A073HZ19_9SPIT|nr:hypothetical protein OXYTRIMIC_273 [Oxytricha trifallax]